MSAVAAASVTEQAFGRITGSVSDVHGRIEQIQVVMGQISASADRVRDDFRHPAETLAFFDVRPGMTVVDFMPAGGWFIIAPVSAGGERVVLMRHVDTRTSRITVTLP